ncbi:MAG: hypothetical protein P8X90_23445, partial [Desulfobacterales bacterium]
LSTFSLGLIRYDALCCMQVISGNGRVVAGSHIVVPSRILDRKKSSFLDGRMRAEGMRRHVATGLGRQLDGSQEGRQPLKGLIRRLVSA